MLGPLVMLSFVELIKSAGARQAKGGTNWAEGEQSPPALERSK
ncbi:MAG: hypothetical protein QOD00_4286 [Blastocatellia bacterium]|jgi:hypothetical protein|nr:hypothetical protein [Blastocatellia bacterium]